MAQGVVRASCRGVFVVDVTFGGCAHAVRAKVSGHLHQHLIRVLPGDEVEVEISPYDLSRGRITYRGRRKTADLPPLEMNNVP